MPSSLVRAHTHIHKHAQKGFYLHAWLIVFMYQFNELICVCACMCVCNECDKTAFSTHTPKATALSCIICRFPLACIHPPFMFFFYSAHTHTNMFVMDTFFSLGNCDWALQYRSTSMKNAQVILFFYFFTSLQCTKSPLNQNIFGWFSAYIQHIHICVAILGVTNRTRVKLMINWFITSVYIISFL